MGDDECFGELPRALAALIEQRVRATGSGERENESEVVALCDALLQTLSSAQLVPGAALLHRVLLFGAEQVRDTRCMTRTLDSLLAARRTLGCAPRFRLCDDDVPEHADALFRLLERLLTRLHEESGAPAAAAPHVSPPPRRKRGRPAAVLVQRFDDDDDDDDNDGGGGGGGHSTSEDVDEPPANSDAEPVSVERDRALELLRFFATLCDLDRVDAAPRPTLAAILLVPAGASGRDPTAVTRHEKRHLARVERLASLLVGCFGHLTYVSDGSDALVSSSARVVLHVRQLLHALAALVLAADADLLTLFNNALLSAFNMLPTSHARTLLVEALRHRAHKLLWLDFVLTSNFISSGVPRQFKPCVLALPTRAKFDTVYRFLKCARGRCDDVVSSLRSLDTFVLLTMHVALELLATVNAERAAGVPSTVLVAADAAAADAQSVEVASPAAAADACPVWRPDIRKDAAKNADPDEPLADDPTLFRIELLENALYQLSCAARLLPPTPPQPSSVAEPARPKRTPKKR